MSDEHAAGEPVEPDEPPPTEEPVAPDEPVAPGAPGASVDQPTAPHDTIGDASPLGAGVGDPDDDAEIRSLLADGHATGKGADVELALANVLAESRKRKLRDRGAVAAAAAAVLLLLIFVAAWDRSDGGGNLETAADGRSSGTTSKTGTSGTVAVYSGDPDVGGTTIAPSTIVDPNQAAPAPSTTSAGRSTTTTRANPPSSTTPANPPVLQLSIHADSASVAAGGRAWFTVQVHNSGGEGTYEGNDCSEGHFKVTLNPALPSAGTEPVSWSGDASTFAAAVSQGGGGLAAGPIVGGSRVGFLGYHAACPAVSQMKKLAPGETLTEKVAADLVAPPGQQLAGSYTATATFAGGAGNTTDSTTLAVTGSVPPLPGAASLQAAASSPAVAGWTSGQAGGFVLQSRYYRGAWEVVVAPKQPGPSSEVLRIRLDPSGTLLDVRAVANGSATSDDPGATAPVTGERKLYP